MYYLFLLTTICLIGISQRGSTESRISQHDGIVQIDFGSNDTRQLRELEKTFINVMRKFIKKDPTNFIQRSKSHLNNGLTLNLHHISKSVSEEIKSALSSLGLIRPKKNRRSLMYRNFAKAQQGNSTNLVEFEFGSATDIVNIIKEIISTIQNFLDGAKYRKRGYAVSNFSLISESLAPGTPYQLEFVNKLGKTRDYIVAFIDCLNGSKSSHFDVRDAFGKITKLPPEITADIVRRRLKRKVPRHPRIPRDVRYSEFQALICHGLVRSRRKGFKPCLRQLGDADRCALGKLEEAVTVDKSLSSSTQNLIKNIENLGTDCQINHNTTVLRLVCKDHSKKKNTYLKMQGIMGRSWSKYIRTLKSTDLVSSDSLEEVLNILEVYQQAQGKLRMMARASQQDEMEYQKLSRSLAEYESNLMSVGLQALKQIHEIATTVEKTFVDTALRSAGVDLSENLRSMRCFCDLFDYILEGLRYRYSSRPTNTMGPHRPWYDEYWQHYPYHPPRIDVALTTTTTTQESLQENSPASLEQQESKSDPVIEDYEGPHKQPQYSPNDVSHIVPSTGSLDQYIQYHLPYTNYYLPMNKTLSTYTRSSSADQSSWVTPWLASMKRLAQVETRRKPSTIMTLANTFLLATIFYECIVILAATISQSESSEKPTASSAVPQPMRPGLMQMSYDDDYGDEYADYSGDRASHGRRGIKRSLKVPLGGQRYKHDVFKQESMLNIDDKPLKRIYNRKIMIRDE